MRPAGHRAARTGTRRLDAASYRLLAAGTGNPARRHPTKILLYDANMTAKPVQISMDVSLLRRVDADPEVREKGRSAFVRSAIELYLTAKERREIDAQIERGYAGEADALLTEAEDLMAAQTWPDD